MRRKTRMVVFGAVLLVGSGALLWTTRPGHDAADWGTADEVELCSVDGRDEYLQKHKLVASTGGTLLGYPVLGKVEVTDAAERRCLASAFTAALQPGYGSKCFWPRHIVRLRHGSRTTEFVICFQCQSLLELVDGKKVRRTAYQIDRAARPAFDAPLTAAGVPIAPD